MQKGSITFHYKPKKKIVYKLDNEKLDADTKLSKKARSNSASKFKRDNNKTKILENHIERTNNSDNSIFINTESNTSFLKKKRKKNESVTKTKIVNSNLYHKDAAKSKISTSEIKKSKKKSRKTKKLITLMKTPTKTNLRNIVFESEDNYNSNNFSTIQSNNFSAIQSTVLE